MTNRYVEKTFLYLLALSVLFHLAVYQLFSMIPPEKKKAQQPVTMVDLTDLPTPPPQVKIKPGKSEHKPNPEPPKALQLPKPMPVQRPMPVPRPKPLPPPLTARVPVPKPAPLLHSKGSQKSGPTVSHAPAPGNRTGATAQKSGEVPITRGEGLLKSRKGDNLELAKLFPNGRKMESMEETYREKYGDKAQSDTRMIDTNDPTIASFSRRFHDACQSSVDFHSDEIRVLENAEGVLEVTVKRDGTIEDVAILEHSRHPDLDGFFVRSIKSASYVGPLPKSWPHDKLKLIWVFYSRAGSGIRYQAF